MRATKKSSDKAKSLTNAEGSIYPITIEDIFKNADNSELKKKDLGICKWLGIPPIPPKPPSPQAPSSQAPKPICTLHDWKLWGRGGLLAPGSWAIC